jgi:hypothetical protein
MRALQLAIKYQCVIAAGANSRPSLRYEKLK